jgi:hypothetical protein
MLPLVPASSHGHTNIDRGSVHGGRSHIDRLGREKVYLIDGCCELTGISESLCHLMQVDPMQLAQGMSPAKAIEIITKARLHGSHARQVDGFSRLFKRE